MSDLARDTSVRLYGSLWVYHLHRYSKGTASLRLQKLHRNGSFVTTQLSLIWVRSSQSVKVHMYGHHADCTFLHFSYSNRCRLTSITNKCLNLPEIQGDIWYVEIKDMPSRSAHLFPILEMKWSTLEAHGLHGSLECITTWDTVSGPLTRGG